MNDNQPRWKVCVYYRLGNNKFWEAWREVEEFDDISEMVETGPNRDTIAHIAVTRINQEHPDMTIEQAAPS